MAKLVQYSGKASLRLNRDKVTKYTHTDKKALLDQLKKIKTPPRTKA